MPLVYPAGVSAVPGVDVSVAFSSIAPVDHVCGRLDGSWIDL